VDRTVRADRTGIAQVFIIAAQISAQVHFAVLQARNLSLTAKNARAISVRSGDKTAGFRAITTYIDLLSGTTIEQAQNINSQAILLSRLSVEITKIDKVINNCQTTYRQCPEASHLHSLDKPFERLQRRREKLQTDFDRCNFHITDLIGEARNQMRSAHVIATSSKVEACQAGEFQEALMGIADNIEQTTQMIKQHLQQALHHQQSNPAL